MLKKLVMKFAAVGVLAFSAAMLGMGASQAAIPCQSQCGINNGACHATCSTNYPCHQACDAQYQACLRSC